MLGGDSKRMMMKGNSAILACSCPNKASLSLKPTIISPNTDWLTERNDCSSERPEEKRERWGTWLLGNETHTFFIPLKHTQFIRLVHCILVSTPIHLRDNVCTDARMHKQNLKMFSGTLPLHLQSFHLLFQELYCASCMKWSYFPFWKIYNTVDAERNPLLAAF